MYRVEFRCEAVEWCVRVPRIPLDNAWCRDNRSGVTATSRHRFSEFAAFDAALRRALAKIHMWSNLPALPPRRWRLFVDHTTDAFLEERRAALEAYLRQVLHLPGMVQRGVVRKFLDLDGGA